MVVILTFAGKQAEQAALMGTPIPPIQSLIIGDGQPPLENQISALTSVVNEVYRTTALLVSYPSPTTVKLTVSLPVALSFWIREVGIELSDGTLYGYTPFRPATNGYYKGNGIALSFSIYITRDSATPLVFTFEPISTSAITQQITSQVLAQVETAETSTDILRTISGAIHSIYDLHSRINELYGVVQGLDQFFAPLSAVETLHQVNHSLVEVQQYITMQGAVIEFLSGEWTLAGEDYYLDLHHNLNTETILIQVIKDDDPKIYIWNHRQVIDENTLRLLVSAEPDSRFSGKAILLKI